MVIHLCKSCLEGRNDLLVIDKSPSDECCFRCRKTPADRLEAEGLNEVEKEVVGEHVSDTEVITYMGGFATKGHIYPHWAFDLW